MASECAVASLSVVFGEPGGKCFGSLSVGVEDAAVGPLGLQGAVEAFDLAVLPGAVRFDELVPSPEGGYSRGEVVGAAVAEVVVGQDAFDVGDAVLGEVLRCPQQLSLIHI